jgi:outer membrane protein assembly factor BamE (lipoprotein component of BamABCDE complex)
MKTSIAILAALVASGCAAYSGSGLRPGSATADDVRRTMGQPAVELPEPGGGTELVYPHGPLGTQTFIAHLDAHGVLQGVDQVLDDDHFRAIHPGQTRADVLRMIGPPGETMQFSYGRHAWQYRFMDSWGYLSEFSVTFDRNDIVIDKVAIRFERNDGRDR